VELSKVIQVVIGVDDQGLGVVCSEVEVEIRSQDIPDRSKVGIEIGFPDEGAL